MGLKTAKSLRDLYALRAGGGIAALFRASSCASIFMRI
jgi:hypothetical protein